VRRISTISPVTPGAPLEQLGELWQRVLEPLLARGEHGALALHQRGQRLLRRRGVVAAAVARPGVDQPLLDERAEHDVDAAARDSGEVGDRRRRQRRLPEQAQVRARLGPRQAQLLQQLLRFRHVLLSPDDIFRHRAVAVKHVVRQPDDICPEATGSCLESAQLGTRRRP
jgi:hypothetical protein